MQVELTTAGKLISAPRIIGDGAAREAAHSPVAEQARGRYIFPVLLSLIALTALPYGTAAPWWESLFECGVFTLGIIWVCGAMRRGDFALKGDPLLYPVLALLVFAVAQTMPIPWSGGTDMATATIADQAVRAVSATRHISAAPFETRRFVLQLLALAVAGGLLRACVRLNERRLRALVYVVIGIGLFSTVFALIRQAAQGENTFFVLPLLKTGTGYGQFINHNHFAFLIEMSWGVVWGLTFGGASRKRLPLYIVMGALMWSALVLSNSRGGIFSMLGQFCMFALLWPRLLTRRGWRGLRAERRRASADTNGHTHAAAPITPQSLLMRVGVSACLLAVIVVGVFWVGGDALASRLDDLPLELRAAGEANPRLRVRRIEMWEATWHLFKANPVLGIGFGGYEHAVTEHYDASGNWTLREAHNDYLELLASGGAVGSLIVLWFIAVLTREARRGLRARDAFRRAACRGALVGLCGVALHSLVDFGLHLVVNAVVGVALIVIATVHVELDEEEEHESAAWRKLPSDNSEMIQQHPAR